MPRSKEETLIEVKAQVKERQTTSGVKDAYTQHWIEQLIECTRKMQKEQPDQDHVSIQTELYEWAEQHEDDIYSGFLMLKGEFSIPRLRRWHQ
jgi:hypothetical protein